MIEHRELQVFKMRLNCLLPMLALSPLVQGAPSVENSQLSPRGLEELERSIEARGWIDDLWKAIKDTASCAGCQVSIPRFESTRQDPLLTVHRVLWGY